MIGRKGRLLVYAKGKKKHYIAHPEMEIDLEERFEVESEK